MSSFTYHSRMSNKRFAGTKLPDGDSLVNQQNEHGDKFIKKFRTITADNGSEFARLHELEKHTNPKVYFTHPFSSFEKDTIERHNGLIHCFIPKGRSIDDYSEEQIGWIEDWINTLPRKILNYSNPEKLFEAKLYVIYAV